MTVETHSIPHARNKDKRARLPVDRAIDQERVGAISAPAPIGFSISYPGLERGSMTTILGVAGDGIEEQKLRYL